MTLVMKVVHRLGLCVVQVAISEAKAASKAGLSGENIPAHACFGVRHQLFVGPALIDNARHRQF